MQYINKEKIVHSYSIYLMKYMKYRVKKRKERSSLQLIWNCSTRYLEWSPRQRHPRLVSSLQKTDGKRDQIIYRLVSKTDCLAVTSSCTDVSNEALKLLLPACKIIKQGPNLNCLSNRLIIFEITSFERL